LTRLLAVGCLVVGACNDNPVPAGVAEAARVAAPAPEPSTEGQTFPLQEWMTSNFSRAIKTPSFEVLTRALSVVARNAPAGFPDWAPLAERGARAAAARDINGVRQNCADCHHHYRASYRRTLRAHPYPLED